MTKTPQQALVPFDEAARESIGKLKPGAGVFVEIKRARNVAFHRKFFTLLNLAFDIWEPEAKTYKGQQLAKDFERFREDITILAGHYDAVYCINGEVKLKAKSIAFANCDEEEFERVYKGVLDVVWAKILKQANYQTPEDVDRVVNQLLAYS
jgi:hypothetical protein